MMRVTIVGPLIDVEYESPEHRHAHCMEALRERFLDEVSARKSWLLQTKLNYLDGVLPRCGVQSTPSWPRRLVRPARSPAD